VTLVNTVPSAMNALLQVGLPSNIQTVCMAGEFLPTELVDRVYASGVEQVFDLYGPTETTTYSTCALRKPSEAATIGKPIANTRIYLLDANLMQVPPGALGEIFIGGEGVTRGYLDRPELTAERFLTLPSLESHSRLYRTGDLARQLDDGSLIYLGRRDQQIKLRGHRIELGEIEAALRDISEAKQVAVVVQERSVGDTLVAFVTADSQSQNTSQRYISELRKRLPAYMIPALIISVVSMPLTPNGKIDRKALAIATEEDARRDAAPQSEAPQDLLEQWLANIWAARLRRKHVTRSAHFFDDLGGHSLVAFEIFSDIEKRLGVVMMLATLFQAPTIELLAAAIRRQGWKNAGQISMVSAGLADQVIYIIGKPHSVASVTLEELFPAGNRAMSIEQESVLADTDLCLSEITSFEVNKPSLILIVSSKHAEMYPTLVAGLTQAGFPDVSLRDAASFSLPGFLD
jgi:acyl carrier protein